MLNENFKDILSMLSEAGADYLVVGAYAMAAHGCPRATGDIDIWVRPTEANSARVWAALQAFRASLSKVTQADFHTPDVVDGLSVPVIGLRQLYSNKMASARDKDLLDAKLIRDRIQ